MENITYLKNTLALLIFGFLFFSIFGWWLRQRYHRFDFSQRYGKFLFLLDNYELVGGVVVGIGLILLAIVG